MPERVACEFRLIRYVPDPVKGEFANIGVVLRAAGESGQAAVRFTRDWRRVRCLHPDADVEMLQGLEGELAERLAGVSAGAAVESKPVMDMLEDTLSNSLQISASRGTLAESFPAEMELLLRMYVEPLKVKAERRAATGRTAIAGRMRRAFERVGVRRVDERDLELTAVIEQVSSVRDAEMYGFGVHLMEEAGLRVLTVADLGRVAETARRELRI